MVSLNGQVRLPPGRFAFLVLPQNNSRPTEALAKGMGSRELVAVAHAAEGRLGRSIAASWSVGHRKHGCFLLSCYVCIVRFLPSPPTSYYFRHDLLEVDFAH